jgi:transposase
VEVLWLPTYAPWLNPIEKLWRWLKQDVTHAHPWCDDMTEYRQQITTALESIATGSQKILNYVGLSK